MKRPIALPPSSPRVLLLAALVGAAHSATAPAHAQEAERSGGRFGVSLMGSYASAIDGAGDGHAAGAIGPVFRFGGAITDRFHLLGELTLQVLPGATVSRERSASGYHPALALAAQGYIGPRFYLRGGVGVGWVAANADNTWYLPLPGPRVSGGFGYDLWRSGERSFSVSFEFAYTFLSRASDVLDRFMTAGLGVGFDWY